MSVSPRNGVSVKRVGDTAEREAEQLLRRLGFASARRQLGAGRKDDIGDIAGVPGWTVQVTRCSDPAVASRLSAKLRAVEEQRARAGTARGVVLLRLSGPGRVWRACVPYSAGSWLVAPAGMPAGAAARWLPMLDGVEGVHIPALSVVVFTPEKWAF